MSATEPTTLSAALDALRRGEPAIVVHGERKLLLAPAALTTESVLRKFEELTSAPISLALDSETFDELGLGRGDSAPAQDNPVGLPIDFGVTGIDAMGREARARAIEQVGRGNLEGVLTPGHVPTVRSSPGNLLSRIGLVEAAIDLVALAAFRQAATIAFLVDDQPLPADIAQVQLSDVRTSSLESAGGVTDADVKSLFIGAMSRLVAPVAVITSSPNGVDPHGLVVSSLTSYSSEPPSVVFSIALSTRSYQTLHSTDRFAVHILSGGQDEYVRAFSSRSADKFAGLDWHMEEGVPLLEGAQTRLICRKIGELRLGDHALFVGAILDGEASEREPMAYFDRKFDWELRQK